MTLKISIFRMHTMKLTMLISRLTSIIKRWLELMALIHTTLTVNQFLYLKNY